MKNDFDTLSKSLFESPISSKLSGKKNEFEKLAGSADGQKVRAMIENSDKNLMDALEKGDTETLKAALANILKTKEGANIADQLSKLIR